MMAGDRVRRGRPTLRMVLVCFAACLGVIAHSSAEAAAALTTKQTQCTNLVVLGARGSGQGMNEGKAPGFGPQASGAARAAVARVTRSGSVRFAKLPYDAVKLGTVFQNMANGKYNGSVQSGAKLLRSVLTSIKKSCGTRTAFLLVGYSQGAEVIRTAVASGLARDVRDRIAGIGLIGDPTYRGLARSPIDAGTHDNFGGVVVGKGRRSGDAIPADLSANTVHLCQPRDPVCNNVAALKEVEHTQFYVSTASQGRMGASIYNRLAANDFR